MSQLMIGESQILEKENLILRQFIMGCKNFTFFCCHGCHARMLHPESGDTGQGHLYSINVPAFWPQVLCRVGNFKTGIHVCVPLPTFRDQSRMSGLEIFPHPTCEVNGSGDCECLHPISRMASESEKWDSNENSRI